MTRSLDAIVLAAGRASRFGESKCLLPAGPGETLLSRATALAIAAVAGRVAIVVGHEPERAASEVDRGLDVHASWRSRVTTVVNPRYADGLSTSLEAGVDALPGSRGALILLADQPAVELARVQALVSRFDEGQPQCLAVAASVRGEQRTPVVLSATLFDEIRRLTGDQGARRVLASHADRVTRVDWQDGLWCADVDTREDYERVARALGWDTQRR